MTYLLALDQGTTSSRAIVFRPSGEIVALAQQEFATSYPRPGWVEQDAEEIWDSQLACARAALDKAGLRASDLAALGITNQRETTILWERATGRPVHPALVWQDRRTADACAALKAGGHEPLVQTRTGLLLDPYFSGTKVAWILDQVPGARARAERGELAFGTVDSWLLWKLTGRHATDTTNASRTLLFDIHRGVWDPELLDLLRVPERLLPEVRPSASDFGSSDPRHLGAPVRIGGVAGDQQAALFGQACFAPGLAKNTYGTGCFLLMATGAEARASARGLLTTRAASAESTPAFALEGSVFTGGAVVQWLRDGLGLIQGSSEVEALARSVPDNGGVALVPAFTGLGAPYWDPHARGGLLGLTRGAGAGHIARAALEAIAFQSAELMEAMAADAAAPVLELRVDGGAAANDLLMQFQADLLGIPVLRPAVTETTALGAAYLAGLTAGIWKGPEAIAAQWRAARAFEPAMPRDEAASRMAWWRKAVARVLRWEEL
ncbi:MAG TPA: glycerol kinase GlpK [Holophagaceae bacterium]|nr:glycerol kinase GlpK [Holophagaceae bacterium]